MSNCPIHCNSYSHLEPNLDGDLCTKRESEVSDDEK